MRDAGMREQGCPEEELLAFLSAKLEEDQDHRYILSSMCSYPHPVAVKVHDLFMGTNLGDPGLFPGTASIERLLVQRLGTLFHHPGACGYATSGGTESNIQALRIARAMSERDRVSVVLPESAHFSFAKACGMLGLAVRPVPADKGFRMDPVRVQEAIDRDTCAVVAVAGTTEYGMVDPIPEIAAITQDAGIPLHVDAAFGGLVIPFLKESIPFDFAVPGVTSIAVDPHKMGMSTIPAGCLLLRDTEQLCSVAVDTPYLSVKLEFTLTGTRPGGPVAGAFAVLEYLGMEGMRAVVTGCMKNTRRLIEGMETLGFPRAATPDVNVATFTAERAPPPWQVSFTRKGHMRIVCMPHVSRDRIEAFLRDMESVHD
jgi:tyrosine decarboxylase/aspartate 1-decarboxylase